MKKIGKTVNSVNTKFTCVTIENIDTSDDKSLKESTTDNLILTQLHPLVIALKIFGTYPITNVKLLDTQNENCFFPSNFSSNLKKQENLNYYKSAKYQWNSAVTLSAYFLKAWVLVTIITWISNLSLGVSFPLRWFGVHGSFETSYINNPVVVIFNRGIVAITGSTKILEILFLFLNIEHFVTWLNNWSLFEKEFLYCFYDSNHVFNLGNRHFRNVVLFLYVGVFGSLWLISGIFAVIYVYTFPFPYVGWLSFFLVIFGTWFNSLLEDGKLFIMINSMTTVLEQIRLGIVATSASRLVTTKDVIAWMKLIRMLRDQVDIACLHLKSQQLLLLAEAVISGSLGLTVLISVIGERSDFGFTIFLLVWSIFTRMYLKVLVADKFNAKERILADVILDIDFGDRCEWLAKSELKFLHNFLSANSVSTINFGNYVTLNKNMLLQAALQVVTFLIVFMQLTGKMDTSA